MKLALISRNAVEKRLCPGGSAGATSSNGPRSRVHMVARGQTAPILQLSIIYRMHWLPTLCGLILASALLIWGNFGGPSPEMVRGSGEKVMGIDSPYGDY